MRVENLASVIDGRILNEPKISQISGFSVGLNGIKNGEAFIDLSGSANLLNAINGGAYAVISPDEAALKRAAASSLFASEIALIAVSDISHAASRLARFLIEQKSLQIYRASKIQIHILRALSLPSNLLTASTTKELLNAIFIAPNHSAVATKIAHAFSVNAIMRRSAGVSLGGGEFFINVNSPAFSQHGFCFPAVFASDLMVVLDLLEELQITAKWAREIEHFRAIFVGINLKIAPFGGSERAIIVESDLELFNTAKNWLLSRYSDIITLSPSPLGDLKSILNKDKSWRYALILGDFDEIYSALNCDDEPKTKTLFD